MSMLMERLFVSGILSRRTKIMASVGSLLALVISFTIQAAGSGSSEIKYADPDVHFHPKGKPQSEHTLAIIKEARETMPFEDTRDFDEAKKGFIAPLKSGVVMADAGHVAWDRRAPHISVSRRIRL